MKKPKHEIVKLPQNFRPYPAGDGLASGAVEVDLGEWTTDDGRKRFHMRINVADMAPLIEAIEKSRGRSKTLYRCLHVFRVADECRKLTDQD